MEVDETKIGKRKSQWLFGLVERETGELRLELSPLNKRDSVTLTDHENAFDNMVKHISDIY